MRCRFDSELRPLFADLPLLRPRTGAGPSAPSTASAPGRARQQAHAPRGPWWPNVRLFPLVLGLLVVVLLTDTWWVLLVAWMLFVCRPRHRRIHR